MTSAFNWEMAFIQRGLNGDVPLCIMGHPNVAVLLNAANLMVSGRSSRRKALRSAVLSPWRGLERNGADEEALC